MDTIKLDSKDSKTQKLLSKTIILSHIKKVKSPLLFGVAILGLTSVVGYRFYDQPELSVGTEATETIIAPRYGKFEDEKKTEEKRKEVRTAINPVLKRSIEKTDNIKKSLQTFLAHIDSLREVTSLIPFVPTYVLSSGTQSYLLSASESKWENILRGVSSQESVNSSLLSAEQRAIAELQRYQNQALESDWKELINQVNLNRRKYSQLLTTLRSNFPSQFSVETTQYLIELSESEWNRTKTEIQKNMNKILTQGLPEGLTQNHLQEIIKIQLNDNLNRPQTKQIASDLLFILLKDKSNLEIDREATSNQVNQAAETIQPFYLEIQRGEVIVEKGQVITQEDFVLLDGFELSRRGIDWQGLGKTGLLVTGSVIIFWLAGKKFHRHLRGRDYLLICLLSVSTPLLAILKVPYTNLAAVGLLASSFYGSPLAITQVVIVTGLTAFTTESLNANLLAGAAGGLLAAFMASKLRSRDELAILGGGVGLVQGSIYCISYLIVSSVPKIIWLSLLPDAIVYGLSGLAWSIVALGISPYLERLFDVVTPIRLIELSNPNSALLKRLATETPGTFQHTLLVACLAEAAARKLHCNVELVRAGTLYHDIGKMHDPLGFIENQMGGLNKHDQINNPYESVEIIKKHVSEGIVMARKYGLPRVIQDFIPEHQGTLLVAYFYHQAKQQAEKKGETVSEEDFRYPGPIPQSRETGIVMLADGCEAALRSLKNATPDIALSTVKKMLQARWRDGQLKDSGIKYEELKTIAEVFVQVWQQFNHQRIAYPKAALEPQASG